MVACDLAGLAINPAIDLTSDTAQYGSVMGVTSRILEVASSLSEKPLSIYTALVGMRFLA
jgi:hypothetical protein